MWNWVRRLWIWPFHRSSDPPKEYPSPQRKRRWWWPGDYFGQADKSVSFSEQTASKAEDAPKLVVVHAGGAVLRASPTIHSPTIGSLRRGEVVPIVKELGRRACVLTPEGAKGWISTVSAEGETITRRITASTRYKRSNMPQEGTSAFADAFEARWQEKWKRVRVDADRGESRPHSIRSSLPALPTRSWRPSSKLTPYNSGSLKMKLRRRPPRPPQPVPALKEPASARDSVHASSGSASASASAADEHQPLMALHGIDENLPDLIAFDTWPKTNRSNSKVPSLAELLGSDAPKASGSSDKTSSLHVGHEVSDEEDGLGKHAIVFNTEPLPSSASRSKVTAAPPRRGISLTDFVDRSAKELSLDSNAFEYLLKESVVDPEPASTGEKAEASEDAEKTATVVPADATDEETAAEILRNFPEPTAVEETHVTGDFQFDPVPRMTAKAKRSARKLPARFPRRVNNRGIEEFLDVEQFIEPPQGQTGATEGGHASAAASDSSGAIGSTEYNMDAFDDFIGEPTSDLPEKALTASGADKNRKPAAQAHGIVKGLCEVSAAAGSNLADVPVEAPNSRDTTTQSAEDAPEVAEPKTLNRIPTEAVQSEDPVSTPPVSAKASEGEPAASPNPLNASPLSQSSLLELASLPSEAGRTDSRPAAETIVAGDNKNEVQVLDDKDMQAYVAPDMGQDVIPDLSANPFFDVSKQSSS